MNQRPAHAKREPITWNRKLLFSSLRSYAIVLIIPFLLCSVFYFLSLAEAKRGAIHLNTQVLAAASAQVDIHLNEVDSIAQEIISSNTVRAFQWKSTGFDYPNAYRLIEVRDSLGNYTMTQEFIDHYFLLFNHSRIAMSSSFIYSYQDFFTHYLNLTEAERADFSERLTDHSMDTGLQPAREMKILNQDSRRYLMLVEPFIDLGDGYICMLIDDANITSMFDSINLSDTGCVYVADRSGAVITHTEGADCDFESLRRATQAHLDARPEETDFTLTLSGQAMLVNVVHAAGSGMTYVAVQPLDVILAQVNMYRNVMLLCFAAALLLGFLLCLRQARQATSPVSSLMEAVGLYSGDSMEALRTVQDIVVELQADNENLQRIAGEHKLLLRSSFTSRLLRGSFSSDAEALRLGQTLIPEYAHFTSARVLLFHLAPRMETAGEDTRLKLAGSMKVALKDILDQVVDSTLSYDTDEETLALVVFNQDHGAINALFGRLRGELPQSIRDSLTVFGGSSCTPPLPHISRSFESARSTMAAYLLSERGPSDEIIWADRRVSALHYFFPPDMRYRLTESVTHGMWEDVEGILNELFQANLLERALKPAVVGLFVSDLVSSGINCLPLLPHPLGDDDVNERAMAIINAPLLRKREMILDFFCELTRCADVPQGDASQVIRQGSAYIASHYSESGLSLTSIAGAFTMNASVLSTMFKQQTGKNLSTYLEDMRISEAKRLLRTTDWTINRIAEAVGYLSANTFCRAFRRNTGKNASAYRAMAEQKTAKGEA